MRRIPLVLIAAVLLTGGCNTADRQEVLVSAAASLTDAFAAIETAFEELHPDIDIVLNLGGSSALREQLLAGAPADVFASANQANMDSIAAAGLVIGNATDFAINGLEIAVPSGNPANVAGLSDFDNDTLLLGLCAAAVPCGDLARTALANAGIEPAVDTNEPSVRALLTKIEAGELDAGIVYASDVATSRGRVDGIPIASEHNLTAHYPIAVLRAGRNGIDAQTFVDFVTSQEGRQILSNNGFRLP